jgi:hypothetical protein
VRSWPTLGRVSAADAEARAGQVYADFDGRRREREAEQAREEEERDLVALVELERRGHGRKASDGTD